MTPQKRRIIALCVRFENACADAEDRMFEALEFDSEFDGGEFSGPAHLDMLRDECQRIARRLGFEDGCIADRVSSFLGVGRLNRPGYNSFME